MGEEMPKYRKIDMENWPRREHFNYYRNIIRCGYSLTSRLDVTKLYDFTKKENKRFYGCFIYAASKAVNQMDSMRMMITEDGTPGVWEHCYPNFTIFHEDDKTFSDIWTEYSDDFDEFYDRFEEVLDKYSANKGIKARPNQPANFFCISCAPWIDFEAYSTHSVGDPALFPIMTFGKIREEGAKKTVPLTLTISHASADGYHAGELFRILQEELNNF